MTPISRRPAGLVLALTFVVLVLYARTVGHPFTNYDDHAYVTDNQHVNTGLTVANVAWAFTSGYAANWHPLTWLSHQLDVQVFGLNPGPMHLVSALLHAANAALLLVVLGRLTNAVGRSAVVAALFALHPMRVESVAWIAERKDVLSGFFWLLTILSYQRYCQQRRLGRYLEVALCFSLGLLAKPMVVTLPAVLLLLDFWPLGRLRSARDFGRLFLEKLPLFALSLAASTITFLVQRTGGAVVSLSGDPLPARLGHALFAYWFYLGKLLWPAELFVPYWYDWKFGLWTVAGALGGLLLLTVVALRCARSCPWLVVGWLWFLGTLLPVIGLVAVGSQSAADRYTYLPSIGLSIAVVWGAVELVRRGCLPMAAIQAAAVLAVGMCAVLTVRQLGYWRDSVTLFQHTLDCDPPNLIAMDLLAWTYATDLDPRIRDGAKAVQLATFTVGVTQRTDGWSLATLAAAHAEAGHFPLAIQTAEEALRLPDVNQQPQLVTDLQANLDLYRTGRAIHGR